METMKDFERELEASFRKINVGDIIKGVVIAVNEEEVVLVREKVTKVRQKNTENKVSERQFSKEKKIRKMYEDLVFRKNLGPKPDKAEKQLVTNRLKHQTPKEQCRYLNSGEVIRRMYEKARYSGEEVSKDDVKAMKEICTLESKSR